MIIIMIYQILGSELVVQPNHVTYECVVCAGMSFQTPVNMLVRLDYGVETESSVQEAHTFCVCVYVFFSIFKRRQSLTGK